MKVQDVYVAPEVELLQVEVEAGFDFSNEDAPGEEL